MQKDLAQALDYAILQGWMPRNQNPATKQKGEESKHDPKQISVGGNTVVWVESAVTAWMEEQMASR